MRKIRFLTLFFCFIFVFSVLVSSMALAEEQNNEKTYVLGETVDAWPEEVDGVKTGGATAHGQNQTRLLYVGNACYISCPLGDYSEVGSSFGTRTEIGLWRLNEDKSIDFICKYSVYGVAAGTTSNVMADKDGNVWVCSSWDEGSGFYHLYGMKYDVKTGVISEYDTTRYAKKGSAGGGKPVSIMDAKYNRIYQFGHAKQGTKYYLTWYILDLATGEWSQIYQVKTNAVPTFYHYGFADDNGGFFIINETCDDNYAISTNIAGLDVETARKTLHSHYQNAGYIWWNSALVYVPDATKAEGYCQLAHESLFDVEKGVYPNNYNMANDLYFDKSTGYLYSIVSMFNDTVAGYRKILQVFDTKQISNDPANELPFKLILEKDLYFLYGNSNDYFQHFFKDSTGKLYLVAVTSYIGEVEIWEVTNEQTMDLKLVYMEEFRGYVDVKSGTNTYGMIIANERNNSTMDDTCRLMLWSDKVRGWVYFTVDFSALRTVLGK